MSDLLAILSTTSLSPAPSARVAPVSLPAALDVAGDFGAALGELLLPVAPTQRPASRQLFAGGGKLLPDAQTGTIDLAAPDDAGAIDRDAVRDPMLAWLPEGIVALPLPVPPPSADGPRATGGSEPMSGMAARLLPAGVSSASDLAVTSAPGSASAVGVPMASSPVLAPAPRDIVTAAMPLADRSQPFAKSGSGLAPPIASAAVATAAPDNDAPIRAVLPAIAAAHDAAARPLIPAAALPPADPVPQSTSPAEPQTPITWLSPHALVPTRRAALLNPTPDLREALPVAALPMRAAPQAGSNAALPSIPAAPEASSAPALPLTGAPTELPSAPVAAGQAPVSAEPGEPPLPVELPVETVADEGLVTIPAKDASAMPTAERLLRMPTAAAAPAFVPLLAATPPAAASTAAQLFAPAMLIAAGETPSSDPVTALISPGAGHEPLRATVQAMSAADQAPLDLGRDDWTGAMIDRIAALQDAAEAADTRIRLAPENLGAIDVAVRRDGDRIHIHFTADSAATRQLLTDAAPRLVELAEARGLKLGQASVDSGAGGQHGAPRDTPRQPTTARPATAADRRDELTTDHRIA